MIVFRMFLRSIYAFLNKKYAILQLDSKYL